MLAVMKLFLYLLCLLAYVMAEPPAGDGYPSPRATQYNKNHPYRHDLAIELKKRIRPKGLAFSRSATISEEYRAKPILAATLDNAGSNSRSNLLSSEYGAPAARGTPNQEYGAPSSRTGISQEYGLPGARQLPSQEYGVPAARNTPNQEYGAPAARNAPNQEYGVPATRHSPNQEYGVPASRNAPNQEYGAPASRNAPNQEYGAPASRNSPNQEYGVPAARNAPNQEYGVPATRNNPNQEYGVPAARNTPNQEYGAPSAKTLNQEYGVQNAKSVALSQEYGVPQAKNAVPSSEYGPPGARTLSQEYGPPPRNAIPNQEYGVPSARNAGLSQEYGAPNSPSKLAYGVPRNVAQEYGVPSKERVTQEYSYLTGVAEPNNSEIKAQDQKNFNQGFQSLSNEYLSPSGTKAAARSSYFPTENDGSSHTKAIARNYPTFRKSLRFSTGTSKNRASTKGRAIWKNNQVGRVQAKVNGFAYPGSGERSIPETYGPPKSDISRSFKSNQEFAAPELNAGYVYAKNSLDELNQEPASYNFAYKVSDVETGSDFGHTESRQANKAEGSYYVVLPDGNKQIVEYKADERGFKPRISLEAVEQSQEYDYPNIARTNGLDGPY